MIDYLAHLRADVNAVVDVLHRGDLAEPVAACPGWTLRDLVEHLGNVHRWAEQIVATGDPGRDEEHDVPDLPRWFADGAAKLMATLAAADPSADCWSFTTDRTAGFWRRRQALETVVHRWDAERSVGEPGAIDPQLASDGVSEVVDLMMPRQVKLGRIAPPSRAVALESTDTEQSWLLGPGEPTATVRASAETLLLLLWHRVAPGDPRLRTTGDPDDVLRLALTP